MNDVGQDSWEEVNLGVAGANYGWPSVEGNESRGVAGMRYPIYVSERGSNCAITGAAFYRPDTTNFPAEYSGRYFFGDFCGGFIRTLNPPDYTQSTWLCDGDRFLVDIQVSQRMARCITSRAAATAKCFASRTQPTRHLKSAHNRPTLGRRGTARDVPSDRIRHRLPCVIMATQRREHNERDFVDLHDRCA